jgi:rhodanese-related sulfurtransferase
VAGVDRLARAYLGADSAIETITREELAQRLRKRNVLVLDIRPTAEFEAGHIQGARSIPPDEVQRRLRDVNDDVEIVAYCRGPFCVYANDAVRALRRRGVDARRLEDGFPEWRRAGLPVASGTGDGT